MSVTIAAEPALQIKQFACLADNYGFLIRDPVSGETAAIDTPCVETILGALDGAGWKLTQIWNTHWHPDHTGGNLALKEATGARVIGPKGEAGRIPGLDQAVGQGDQVRLGEKIADVLDTPGHTLGHIAFYFAQDQAAFVGDTLFALGCGRLFEGTAPMMWASLQKLASLPPATQIYCAHEYTLANGRFALDIDPDNQALIARMEEIEQKRRNGLPTVPTTIAAELATNPFLQARLPAFQRRLETTDAISAFAIARQRKDRF